MKRTPGFIQTAVLDLIASSEDGAWTMSDLCRYVFAGSIRAGKNHYIAVTSAIKTMDLPTGWTVSRLNNFSAEYCLNNSLSLESNINLRWRGGYDHMSLDSFKVRFSWLVDRAKEAVKEAQNYHSADEAGKLDIQISRKNSQLVIAIRAGDRKWAHSVSDEISKLEAHRKESHLQPANCVYQNEDTDQPRSMAQFAERREPVQLLLPGIHLETQAEAVPAKKQQRRRSSLKLVA